MSHKSKALFILKGNYIIYEANSMSNEAEIVPLMNKFDVTVKSKICSNHKPIIWIPSMMMENEFNFDKERYRNEHQKRNCLLQDISIYLKKSQSRPVQISFRCIAELRM